MAYGGWFKHLEGVTTFMNSIKDHPVFILCYEKALMVSLVPIDSHSLFSIYLFLHVLPLSLFLTLRTKERELQCVLFPINMENLSLSGPSVPTGLKTNTSAMDC